MNTVQKKRIQVQIDNDLVKEADLVFNSLGISPTTAIVALYKRVAAQGGLPFSLQMTDRELANQKLSLAIESLPMVDLTANQTELEAWFDEAE